MPILVMCNNPACGELFDAPDSSAGQEVRCPSCGMAQSLAAAPGPPAAPLAPPAPPPSAAPSPSPSPTGQGSPPSAAPAAPAKEPPASAAPSGTPLFAAAAAARDEEEVSLDVVELDLGDTPAGRGPGSAPVAQAPQPPGRAPRAPRPGGGGARPAPPSPAASAFAKDSADKPASANTPTAESADDLLVGLPLPNRGARPPRDREEPPAPAAPHPTGKGAPPADGFAERGRARLDDLRREGAPQPSAQGELEDAIWTAAPAGDAETDGGAAGGAAGDSVLGSKPATAMIVILGLVGLCTGLAAGIKLFPDQVLLAAYMGAGVGWMAGFTFGTLLVLAAEQAGGKVRCPVCHAEYLTEAQECTACGCQNLGPAPDPLAIECLHAGSFALSNPSGLLPPVALGVLAVLLVSTTVEVLQTSAKEAAQWAPLLIGLSVLVGYGVFSYWMAFLFSAAAQPPPRVNLPSKAPKAPRLASLETVASGFWALAAMAAYVAPLVTIPLLPVAMLLLSTPGRKQAMNPLRSARAAWRHLKGFVVLWMFLMMWLAGAVLAAIVVKILYDLRLSLPPVEGFAGGALKVTLSAFAAAAFGVVASIFGLAMFRCLGAFGKYNASALPPPPRGSR